MVTYTSVQQRNTDFIRKSLDADVFLAPMTTNPPTALTTGAGAANALNALPAGYVDVGYLDKAQGIDVARQIATVPTMSVGQLVPTRNDITKNEVTVKFSMQETKRITLESYHTVNLGGTILTVSTSELNFTEPVRPTTIPLRMLILWTDGTGTDSIFVAMDLPRVTMTSVGNIKISDGVDSINRDVTYTAYTDGVLGYSVRHLYGGPGWAARTAAMQFS